MSTSEPHSNILDQKLSFKDLMDLDLLSDFIGKFGDFAGLKVRLMDEDGSVLMKGQDVPPFCKIAATSEKNFNLCQEAEGECGWVGLKPKEPLLYKCYCGLHYVVLLITGDYEISGRAVFGPFRKPDTEISSRMLDSGIEREELERAFNDTPCMAPEKVEKIAHFFASMMDIFLFLSVKRLFTSRIHLETLYRARDDVFREMENQMKTPEDREELERLKEIF